MPRVTGSTTWHVSFKAMPKLRARGLGGNLTPREFQVVNGLYDGMSYEAICKKYDLADSTLWQMINAVRGKLGITARIRGGKDLVEWFAQEYPTNALRRNGYKEACVRQVEHWNRARRITLKLDRDKKFIQRPFALPKRPKPEAPLAPEDTLTCREIEVCTLLLEGQQNVDIARELGVGAEAVKRHLYHIGHLRRPRTTATILRNLGK
jgi:DNA-binding NarL/FixJ family response regulator